MPKPGGALWWATWALGTPIAFLLLFVPTLLLLQALDVLVSVPLAFAVAGAAAGLTQWALVRQRTPRAGGWILATTVGFLLVGLAYAASVDWGGLVGALLWVVGGVATGWLQWRFVLLRLGVRRRRWLPANAGVFVVAGLVTWLATNGLEDVLGLGVGILVYAIGSALAWRRFVPAARPATKHRDMEIVSVA